MDHVIQNQLDKSIGSSGSCKKPASIIAFLDAKKVDKSKVKEHFLKSQSASLAQEIRLTVYKLFLGTVIFN